MIQAENYVAVGFGGIDVDLAFADGDEVGIGDVVFMSAGHNDAKKGERLAIEEFEELFFHDCPCSSPTFSNLHLV